MSAEWSATVVELRGVYSVKWPKMGFTKFVSAFVVTEDMWLFKTLTKTMKRVLVADKLLK